MSASDPLSLALGQISFAVKEITKKSYKATVTEIHEVGISTSSFSQTKDYRSTQIEK